MALQTQAPAAIALCLGDGQVLSFLAVPARLKKPLRLWGLSGNDVSEQQIVRFMDDHLQLMATAQQLGERWTMSFRRECDPVEATTQFIHSARFEMQWQLTMLVKGICEWLKVVMQGLTPCNHDKFRAVFSRLFGFLSQFHDVAQWVLISFPRVFGIAPGASNSAAGSADEKGTPSGVVAFPLQGMERLYHWIEQGISHRECS